MHSCCISRSNFTSEALRSSDVGNDWYKRVQYHFVETDIFAKCNLAIKLMNIVYKIDLQNEKLARIKHDVAVKQESFKSWKLCSDYSA